MAVLAVVAATLATLAVSLPVPPSFPPGAPARLALATSGIGSASGPSWDNGVVRLAFANPVPSFSVVSDADGRVAASHALDAVAELTPGGLADRIAPFQGPNVSWTFASVPTPTGITVWANASLPVLGANGTWQSDDGLYEYEDGHGKARLSLIFYLNASGTPGDDQVRFTVNVTRWPWANLNDSLGLEMTAVAVPSTTLASGSANSLVEQITGTSTPVATLTWDPEAFVRYAGNAGNTSDVGTYQTVGTGGLNSTIRLQFGAVAGGYQELSYDPTVALNLLAFRPLGPLPAWAWNEQTSVVVLATAGLVGLLALVAWRSRSAPAPPP